MRLISRNFHAVEGHWDDPGDYPNGIASGPLPSYSFIESIDGECEVELSDAERQEWIANQDDPDYVAVSDPVDKATIGIPDGISVQRWETTLNENTLTLSVLEFCDGGYRNYG